MIWRYNQRMVFQMKRGLSVPRKFCNAIRPNRRVSVGAKEPICHKIRYNKAGTPLGPLAISVSMFFFLINLPKRKLTKLRCEASCGTEKRHLWMVDCSGVFWAWDLKFPPEQWQVKLPVLGPAKKISTNRIVSTQRVPVGSLLRPLSGSLAY